MTWPISSSGPGHYSAYCAWALQGAITDIKQTGFGGGGGGVWARYGSPSKGILYVTAGDEKNVCLGY